MKKIRIAILLLPIVLAGCHSSSSVKTMEPAPVSITKDKLELHNWILTRVDGQPLKLQEGDAAPSLNIDATFSANGQGACNRYFGQAELKGNQFRIDKMASTMMACPEPAMNLEGLMSDVLGNWSQISLKGQTLSFVNEKHSLTFQMN